MGLDIRFTLRKNIICHKCGEIIGYDTVDSVDGSGRGWYPLLESLGYYVPYDQRTEENDWYGKDMVLTEEQVDEVYQFAKEHDLYGSYSVQKLIVEAIFEEDYLVINADW